MKEGRLIRDSYNNSMLAVFHRYDFEISNSVGSAKGSVVLIIHTTDMKQYPHVFTSDFVESNPVNPEEFGGYVEQLHSLNNRGFITQYEVK